MATPLLDYAFDVYRSGMPTFSGTAANIADLLVVCQAFASLPFTRIDAFRRQPAGDMSLIRQYEAGQAGYCRLATPDHKFFISHFAPHPTSPFISWNIPVWVEARYMRKSPGWPVLKAQVLADQMRELRATELVCVHYELTVHDQRHWPVDGLTLFTSPG